MKEFLEHLLELNEPQEIEKAVEQLTLSEADHLLNQLEEQPTFPAEKITPIIAGLKLPIFKELLSSSGSFFKHHVHKEALHHKISRIIFEKELSLKELQDLYGSMQKRIEQFPITPVVATSLSALQEELYAYLKTVNESIHLLNMLLELCWLAERVDLIEQLNLLKKRYMYLDLYHQMLLENLKGRLNQTFQAQDQSSALEALISLGLSYEKQWKDFLNLLGENSDGLEESKLLEMMEKRLNLAGLSTVADFKKRGIYTQEELLNQLNQ